MTIDEALAIADEYKGQLPATKALVTLAAEVRRLRTVMDEVGSMPGRNWLEGQLMLAAALSGDEPGEAAAEQEGSDG